MASILTLLAACAGDFTLPARVFESPSPLPDARELAPGETLPPIHDSIRALHSYDMSQYDPRTETKHAFVKVEDSFYPAVADVTIKCPGSLPAYRLSYEDYDKIDKTSITFLGATTEPKISPFEDPSTLIGDSNAAYGTPQCYSREDIIPYILHYPDDDGI